MTLGTELGEPELVGDVMRECALQAKTADVEMDVAQKTDDVTTATLDAGKNVCAFVCGYAYLLCSTTA